MKQRLETLTLTLNWLAQGVLQTTNIVLEDSPPDELIPLLLRGCGLQSADRSGRVRPYRLRLDGAGGRVLEVHLPLSRQGVRTGAHLWLVEENVAGGRRGILRLPDESELLVPRQGIALTRSWLLQGLALLNPELHRQELGRIERRASPYCFVSNRPHCRLTLKELELVACTDRSDVRTLLNGEPLATDVPQALRDGDQLMLGEGGLVLGVTLLRETLAVVTPGTAGRQLHTPALS